MCGDEMVLDDNPVARPLTDLTRRRFMQAVAATAAGGWLAGGLSWEQAASASAVPGDGTSPVSMAMHVHSSFSEQSGSMEGQLFQAQKNAVDVLWWTDHDARMSAVHDRSVVHFTSLTGETTDGGAWQWQQATSGSLSSVSQAVGVVTSPVSSQDTFGGSLSVAAKAASGTASLGFYANAKAAGWNYHGNLYGQTMTFDVLPAAVDSTGYLEFLVNMSYHRPQASRPAGVYSISYRIGGPGTPGTRVANGIQGIVYLPFTSGQWNLNMAVTPCDDIAALWPDMQPHDFASYGLTFSAVSAGTQASGFFDYLRFTRQFTSGDVPLQTQQQMESAYAVAFSQVTQRQGLEVSLLQPHINWFGGAVSLPDYTGIAQGNYDAFVAGQVGKIHAAGGLASYNHPFGYTEGTLLSPAAQDSAQLSIAAKLLTNGVQQCDIMEVGYPTRGGADLGHHLGLWDILSKNGRFITGNGVNDDHFGQNWAGLKNNWYTSVWAVTKSEADLQSALKAGRAWTASLSRFRGTLDLVADRTCPMGSASVSTVLSRSLLVMATGVPTGGTVQVLRGAVDYSGATAPNTRLIATYPASAFAGGSVTLAVDTTSSCFVRTQVLDPTGLVVAASNPIWLLQVAPPSGIPQPRAC